MKHCSTLSLVIEDDIATIALNRPDIRNAFNEVMISEITDAFREIEKVESIRAIILRGEGKSFCAGADLNWMRNVSKYTFEQNYEESYRLSQCFYTIYTSPKPTIALVHGAAIGGANGLLAACDIALCDNETVFSLSEVKIGIVPACISPYVIKRVGEYGARELMLTGRRINGPEAEKYKLVNKSLPSSELESYCRNITDLLKSSGPKAIAQCKKLIDEVTNNITLDEALSYTAHMIAEIRASSEGQEGMAAFLEKRRPNWINESEIN
ncbi:MAG: enoyl-CoA hydratase/isomerase family protein [Bacteroidales bacterium]|nr:enoyl-CoA hydratase/isomerase family protein [Bacteroidales bacterium]